MRGHICCLFFSILSHVPCRGQTPPIFNLSTVNGLPSSNIYRVCQDNKGFLWIATENGLCQYDGSEIKILDARNGMPDNSIVYISKDITGHLWICTYNGGMCWLKDGILTARADSLKLSGEQIVNVVNTRKRSWLLSSRGWLYYTENGKTKLFAGPEYEEHFCNRITAISDTSCIFYTRKGLFIYNVTGGVREIAIPRLDAPQMFFPLQDKKLLAVSDNKIYIITGRKIDNIIHLEKKHVWNDIVRDSRGNIWLASGSELLKWSRNGELIRYEEFFEKNPMVINDLFVDSWDNVWVATYGAGLYCLWNKDITYLPVTPGKINHNVTALCSKDDNMFISSLGGTLALFKHGIITPKQYACNTLNDFTYFGLSIGDTLVVGKNSGLCYITDISDTRSSNCICVPFTGGAISGFVDSKGSLWVGHYNGVTLYNGKVYTMLKDSGIAHRRVNAICEYPKEVYFFGTDRGLYEYDGKKIRLVFAPEKHVSQFITSLKADKEGNLWIGTRGGLFIKPRRQRHIQLYKHELLSHTKISQIIGTWDGALWIGSHQGVYRYINHKLIAFTRQNGLISNHVLSMAMDHENKLWVGTPDGISVIGTERYEDELKITPRLHISEARFNGHFIPYPQQLTLNTRTRNIIITCTSIFFPTSTQIRLQYRIKGLSAEWQELPDRSLILSSLPKGQHKLEIRTESASPDNSPEYVYMDITVTPLFYEKAWFIILAIVSVLLLIFLIVHLRIKNVQTRERIKNRKKLRILHLRLQSVQASLNPHFIFNSMNSLLSLLKTNRKDQAELYLSGFSKLLRSSLQSGAKTYITLGEEIQRIDQYLTLEKIRFADTFDYDITVADGLNLQQIKIPVMVIQPFIENALKHGIRNKTNGKGLIAIGFNSMQSSIKIVIEDNGVGYFASLRTKKEARGHRSLGIHMVQKQLDLLNSTKNGGHSLTISERNYRQGTVVEIRLPLS